VSREPERWPVWLGAVLLAWLATALILYYATGVSRYLGERGLIAIERLMGMLLITVAVQMLMDGLSQAMAR
jgi:multiple antibiotic resistance protein